MDFPKQLREAEAGKRDLPHGWQLAGDGLNFSDALGGEKPGVFHYEADPTVKNPQPTSAFAISSPFSGAPQRLEQASRARCPDVPTRSRPSWPGEHGSWVPFVVVQSYEPLRSPPSQTRVDTSASVQASVTSQRGRGDNLIISTHTVPDNIIPISEIDH